MRPIDNVEETIKKKLSFTASSKMCERILSDVLDAQEKAKEAKAAAEKFLAELHKGKEWEELVKEDNMVPQTTDFFTRRGSIPKIGYAPELQEIAFGLNDNNRYPDSIFENDSGAFVIRWEEKKEIDEEKYQEERERYRFSLMQTKHRRAFQIWLESLKMKAEIRIVNPVSD